MTQFANYLSPLSAAAGAKRSGCFVSAASPLLSSAAPERSRPFPTRSGLSPLTVGATIGRPSSSALPHCPHYQLKLHLRHCEEHQRRSNPVPPHRNGQDRSLHVSALPLLPQGRPCVVPAMSPQLLTARIASQAPPFRPPAASTSSRRRGFAVRPSYQSISAKDATKKSPDGSLG